MHSVAGPQTGSGRRATAFSSFCPRFDHEFDPGGESRSGVLLFATLAPRSGRSPLREETQTKTI